MPTAGSVALTVGRCGLSRARASLPRTITRASTFASARAGERRGARHGAVPRARAGAATAEMARLTLRSDIWWGTARTCVALPLAS